MSKKNKKQNIDNNAGNEVKTEETKIAEGEQTEVKEKKGFFYGVGHVAGVVTNAVSKAVTSTPGKIITGVVVVGSALAGGYAAGKHGIGSKEEANDALTDGSDFAEDNSADTASETEEN